VLQSGGIYSHITPREALRHWASFYPHPRNVEEVLTLAGLQEKADVRSRKLSGGQLRRLDFALALVGDPELIFLDEPTTGFDPAARHAAWETVRSLRDLGKTILLTTHYLDEAQGWLTAWRSSRTAASWRSARPASWASGALNITSPTVTRAAS
jgi:ABC-2 type transport system ATP-binding protein